jgi:hypothetical protein
VLEPSRVSPSDFDLDLATHFLFRPSFCAASKLLDSHSQFWASVPSFCSPHSCISLADSGSKRGSPKPKPSTDPQPRRRTLSSKGCVTQHPQPQGSQRGARLQYPEMERHGDAAQVLCSFCLDLPGLAAPRCLAASLDDCLAVARALSSSFDSTVAPNTPRSPPVAL